MNTPIYRDSAHSNGKCGRSSTFLRKSSRNQSPRVLKILAEATCDGSKKTLRAVEFARAFGEASMAYPEICGEVASHIVGWLFHAEKHDKPGTLHRGIRHTYRTQEQIAEAIGYSERHVNTAIAILIQGGVIEAEKFLANRGNHVYFYRLSKRFRHYIDRQRARNRSRLRHRDFRFRARNELNKNKRININPFDSSFGKKEPSFRTYCLLEADERGFLCQIRPRRSLPRKQYVPRLEEKIRLEGEIRRREMEWEARKRTDRTELREMGVSPTKQTGIDVRGMNFEQLLGTLCLSDQEKYQTSVQKELDRQIAVYGADSMTWRLVQECARKVYRQLFQPVEVADPCLGGKLFGAKDCFDNVASGLFSMGKRVD